MKSLKRNKKGFTLIEIIVVLVIMGVVLRKKWQNVAFKMAKKRCLLKG